MARLGCGGLGRTPEGLFCPPEGRCLPSQSGCKMYREGVD